MSKGGGEDDQPARQLQCDQWRTGPVGALPIQTPVSPDGKNVVTANTLSATITIVDPVRDTVVAMLPCDPGCHGVQYGAKQGGGYYAYVSNKFSNGLIIVDPDPNNDGNPADATIVGRILLTSTAGTASDDTVTGNRGMGGRVFSPSRWSITDGSRTFQRLGRIN